MKLFFCELIFGVSNFHLKVLQIYVQPQVLIKMEKTYVYMEMASAHTNQHKKIMSLALLRITIKLKAMKQQ